MNAALAVVRSALRCLCPTPVPERALTPHQREAFERLCDLVTAGHARRAAALPCYTLAGFAGTGKSFLLAALIRRLGRDGLPLYVTATTHKATRVLERKAAEGGARLTGGRVRTAQSFLGLRPVPDGRGGLRLAPDPEREAPEGAVVVCDEGSMAGRLVYEEAAATTQRGATWLFCGDPAQLPPVGERRSPVFDLEGAALREVVRQGRGNPVLAFATRVREGRAAEACTRMDGARGVAATGCEAAFLESAAGAFERALEAGRPDDARILAYTNRRVRFWNRRVRERLFGPAPPPYLPGEFVTALGTWRDAETPASGRAPAVASSQEFVVVGVAEGRRRGPGFPGERRTWDVLRLTLEDALTGARVVVPVVHARERAAYRRALAARRAAALAGEGTWADFHVLERAFAPVGHAYATTIHRSQGSTYDTAYVDWADTRRCASGRTRRCLRYVAASRPSRRLALLT